MRGAAADKHSPTVSDDDGDDGDDGDDEAFFHGDDLVDAVQDEEDKEAIEEEKSKTGRQRKKTLKAAEAAAEAAAAVAAAKAAKQSAAKKKAVNLLYIAKKKVGSKAKGGSAGVGSKSDGKRPGKKEAEPVTESDIDSEEEEDNATIVRTMPKKGPPRKRSPPPKTDSDSSHSSQRSAESVYQRSRRSPLKSPRKKRRNHRKGPKTPRKNKRKRDTPTAGVHVTDRIVEQQKLLFCDMLKNEFQWFIDLGNPEYKMAKKKPAGFQIMADRINDVGRGLIAEAAAGTPAIELGGRIDEFTGPDMQALLRNWRNQWTRLVHRSSGDAANTKINSAKHQWIVQHLGFLEAHGRVNRGKKVLSLGVVARAPEGASGDNDFGEVDGEVDIHYPKVFN